MYPIGTMSRNHRCLCVTRFLFSCLLSGCERKERLFCRKVALVWLEFIQGWWWSSKRVSLRKFKKRNGFHLSPSSFLLSSFFHAVPAIVMLSGKFSLLWLLWTGRKGLFLRSVKASTFLTAGLFLFARLIACLFSLLFSCCCWTQKAKLI